MELRKPRKKYPKIVVLLVLIAICFLFFSLTVSYVEDEFEIVDEQGQETEYANETYEYCTVVNYSYGYNWIGIDVDAQLGKIIPKMEILNRMDRTGLFRVQFVFVDDEVYPIETYENRISEVVPSFFGREQWLTLYPGNRLLIIDDVEVPELGKEYWSYADITPPNSTLCEIVQKEKRQDPLKDIALSNRRVVKKERKIVLGLYLWRLFIARLGL